MTIPQLEQFQEKYDLICFLRGRLEFLFLDWKTLTLEQRPVVPYTSVSDEYAYGANPHDWHEIVVGTLKW
tara:strand:- start:627 stop:836 length:210 start_codon:yes stop_codon:yes gene_type:complete